MHRHFSPITLALAASFATLSNFAAPPILAQPKIAPTPQKRAISAALKEELNHATPGHIKVSKWQLTRLDARQSWALAGVKPLSGQLDPITVLLHQKRGAWKVVTLGTNLRGSGAQYGVPRHLWKRWDLG